MEAMIVRVAEGLGQFRRPLTADVIAPWSQSDIPGNLGERSGGGALAWGSRARIMLCNSGNLDHREVTVLFELFAVTPRVGRYRKPRSQATLRFPK